jgi:hypothetical protein
MIVSLLYLTVTRPDIQFDVCLCARFQASPTHFTSVSHLVDFQVSQIHTRVLGFGIPLLHHLILFAFLMLILRVVELTEKYFWYMSFSLVC